MNRYQLALGKFPTYAETYDAVLGYKEPLEYQKGRRYDSRKKWLCYFSEPGEHPIRFLEPGPTHYQHYIRGDWVVRTREPTVLEFANLTGRDSDRISCSCPICEAGHQPNRNGRVYPSFSEMIEQAELRELREREADMMIGFAESHETPALIDVFSFPPEAETVTRETYRVRIGESVEYPSSITIKMSTLKKKTYIGGGVIGKDSHELKRLATDILHSVYGDFQIYSRSSIPVSHIQEVLEGSRTMQELSLELDYKYIEQRLMASLGVDRSVLEIKEKL